MTSVFDLLPQAELPILLQRVQLLENDPLDLLITSDRQIQLAPLQVPPHTQILPAEHLILGPGLIDLYSTCTTGFEQRETWASLSQAAIHGGFWQVGLLPPVNNLGELELINRQAPAQLQPWAAISQGDRLNQLAELAPQVLGFSQANPIANLAFWRHALDYLRPLNKPVLIWAYNQDLACQGVMREGSHALEFGLAGVPVMAETSAIAALVELVRHTHTPIHFMRVSSKRSLEIIGQAQAEGLPITASVVWHHLIHRSDQLATYDSALHLAPPLGDQQDQLALIAGIKTGIISAIAIDHLPYTYEEKAVPFENSPPGAIGLEFAFPLLWQHLVTSGKLTPLELWQALSHHPATQLGIPTPPLVTLFDPTHTWQPDSSSLHSLARNTVWLNRQITGKGICLSSFKWASDR
ncbi:MAG: dihydroorotase [Pseudanabaenaceae cyanobacterium bins.68]|nr:dihydroorotase [Pseudanabaenaceae cyanobacterium bins.68]